MTDLPDTVTANPPAAKPRRTRKIAAKSAEVITFTSVIERAIANPDISVEKLERLLAWLDEEAVRLAAAAYNVALAAAQAEMKPIAADCSNDETHSRYASYAALNAAVRPIYTKYGFSLSFNTEPVLSAAGMPQPEQVRVFCIVRNGAHSERHQIDMPVDGKGPKGGPVMTKVHALGSGVTYGRRYLVGMIFDLAVTKDDDGNAAGRSAGVPSTLPPRPHYDNPLGAGEGRPPTMVPSPASKLKAEMAGAAAASPGLERAIADMTPAVAAPAIPAPAIPALTPRRRYNERDERSGGPPEPPPVDRIPDGPPGPWRR